MKAVIVTERGKAGVKNIPALTMRSDYIKVKISAVAINPTDYDHVMTLGLVGGIIGCDASGIVEDVGEDCKTSVKKGDRVFGGCHGTNPSNAEDGAFAEYAMFKDGCCAKIPDSMSFEDAATLGVGLTTVGQALYLTLKLPLPIEPAEKSIPVLIYGGSTATGSLAIQLAKLSGLTVITTASPHNFSLVKSRGADMVFDYRDPNCAANIRKYTGNKLRYVLDTVARPESYKICAAALPDAGEHEGQPLRFVSLFVLDGWPRSDVETHTVLAYTAFGEPFEKFGMSFPAMDEHYAFQVKFIKLCETLLQEGKIVPHPATVGEGGLYGIPEGIQKCGTGALSGEKLVYRTTVDDSTSYIPLVSQEAMMTEKRITGKLVPGLTA